MSAPVEPLLCAVRGEPVTVWSFKGQWCEAHAYRHVLSVLIEDLRSMFGDEVQIGGLSHHDWCSVQNEVGDYLATAEARLRELTGGAS